MCVNLVLVLSAVDPQHYQKFGGHKMVVRFEVDAYLPDDDPGPTVPSNNPTICGVVTKEKPSSGSPSDPQSVTIIREGLSEVPQERLLEIKTHSDRKIKWKEVYPQLYLSQTQHIYYARHKNGKFTSVSEFELGKGKLVKVDQDAQEGFKKLKKLLDSIQSLVLEHGAMRISFVCVGETLSVYRIPQGESCLPEDAMALFVA